MCAMPSTSLFHEPVPLRVVTERSARVRLHDLSLRLGKPQGRVLVDALDALDTAIAEPGPLPRPAGSGGTGAMSPPDPTLAAAGGVR